MREEGGRLCPFCFSKKWKEFQISNTRIHHARVLKCPAVAVAKIPSYDRTSSTSKTPRQPADHATSASSSVTCAHPAVTRPAAKRVDTLMDADDETAATAVVVFLHQYGYHN
mmetsp:Transcript_14245/g.28753  ORF Transcript_14245/g.28753 Transcript_14245/m.28753 type:complete len:112 (-) Transcript_14245:205-540(-)